MEKRYQVFVSSTFEDLREERAEVMRVLLQLNCIPSGMELFPAADEDQWTLIKSVIDDCDYYIVIIAGRYGSKGAGGKSYTRMEYEYAIEKRKPVLAFLHADPAAIPRRKTDPDNGDELEEFRRLSQNKVVRKWIDTKDLASAVVISLTNLIKTKPALGWVRADYLPDDSAALEMLRLRNENDTLKRAIDAVTVERPDEFDIYEFGEGKVELHFTVQPAGDPNSIPVVESFSWNQLFSVLAPLLFEGASNAELKNRLEDYYRNVRDDRSTVKTNAAHIRNHDFEKIKIQFLALRLISRRDDLKPWILTPYGERLLVEIGAERKPH